MFSFIDWKHKLYREPEGGGFNQTNIFTIEGRRNRGLVTVTIEQDNQGDEWIDDYFLTITRNNK